MVKGIILMQGTLIAKNHFWLSVALNILAIIALFQNAVAYYEFEHRFIGNRAYSQAKDEVNLIALTKSTPEKVSKFNEDLIFVTEKIFLFNNRDPHENVAKDYYEFPFRNGRSKRPRFSEVLAAQMLSLVPINFGDISALAGDHSYDVDDLEIKFYSFLGNHKNYLSSTSFLKRTLFLGKNRGEIYTLQTERIMAIRNQWINACRWYKEGFNNSSEKGKYNRLSNCFDNVFGDPNSLNVEKLAIDIKYEFEGETDLRNFYYLNSKGYVRERLEQSDFERLRDYVSLARNNQEHFPQHSWRLFIEAHHRALELARFYADQGATIPMEKHFKCGDLIGKQLRLCALSLALLTEGFAQHFLHDSFSAGHIGASYSGMDKQYLQFVHDNLNEVGLFVGLDGTVKSYLPISKEIFGNSDTREYLLRVGWIAYGDGQILIPEAKLHRAIVVLAAKQSLLQVFKTALSISKEPLSSEEVCKRWIGVFPEPKDKSYEYYTTSRRRFCGNLKEGMKKKIETLDLVDLGISPDPRVGGSRLEGWKLYVSAGIDIGKNDLLNQNGTLLHNRSIAPKISVDIGYVRPTEPGIPNYFGLGGSIVTDSHISFFPLSIGYWLTGGRDERVFMGYRLNLGIRINEAFTERNPSSGRKTSMEISIPYELGFRIFKPLTFYARIDFLNLIFRGIGGGESFGVTADAFYLGRTGLQIGLVYDLAEVF